MAIGTAAAAASTDGPVPTAVVLPDVVPIPVIPANDRRFRHIPADQGLSQTRVAQIVQDDRGFMWFGTQHGLNRYDGVEFRVFKHDPARPDSLGGIFVYALAKSRSGQIWVGTDQSLDVFDSATERFRHVRIPGDPVVIHIFEDEAGMLWLATGIGLFRLDPATETVERFGHREGDPRSLASNDVKSTGLDRKGGFWVATAEGLERFDRERDAVDYRIPLREDVREFSFHEDRAGNFWIVFGSGNGLARFDRERGELTRYSFYGDEAPAGGLTGAYAVLETADGTIWIGTMGAGLLRYDAEHGIFAAYRRREGDPASLAENRVIALFEDRGGNVWAGLHANPPDFVPSSPPPFRVLAIRADNPHADGERLVNTIYAARDGSVWMGAGGAVGWLEPQSGASHTLIPPGGGPLEALTILEYPAGTMWIGTLGRGLLRYDRTTGVMRTYRNEPGNPGSIASDIVTRLFVDSGGRLWLATWNGLSRYLPETDTFVTAKRDPTTSSEGYFSVAEDRRGRLWLGSTAGLHRFDPATGTFASFRHAPGDFATLSNNTVNTVLIARDGTLWVGTQDGLNRYDEWTESFRRFNRPDGLPADVVSCLLEDAEGQLWMSTNAGVVRMDPRGPAFRSFGPAEGLPGNDLTGWNACSRSPRGELAFGGFAGAVLVDPTRAGPPAHRPEVVLTDLKVSGRRVFATPGAPRDGASAAAAGPADLRVAGRDEIVIAFSAPDVQNPRAIRYRYRMAGLDMRWHATDSDARFASYSRVPAGSYHFEVQASHGGDGWTEPGAVLSVTVLPDWWETAWFRAAVVLASLGLATLAYRLRTRQLAQRYAMRLDDRVAERMRIARELHDSLLQSFHGLLFRLQAARNRLPGDPQGAAALLDVALDRADAAVLEGRDTVMGLRGVLSGAELDEALREVADELGGSFVDGPDVSVRVTGERRPLEPMVRDELYRVAREALRNAFQHARASHVGCDIGFGARQFTLTIRDDGAGMDPRLVHAGGKARHWGLPGMRERVQELGGVLRLASEPGRGTLVEIVLPARKAYR